MTSIKFWTYCDFTKFYRKSKTNKYTLTDWVSKYPDGAVARELTK